MTQDLTTTTNDRSTDNPLPFEPYLPGVIQPASRPGRVEELVTWALRHK